MDPLTRGSLFHARRPSSTARSRPRRACRSRARTLPAARRRRSTRCSTRRRASTPEKLAPAIERVWRDEIDELRRDLGIWVQRLADEDDWVAGVLRVQLRPERRGARSAQPAGSDHSSTAGSCCADRSISSSVTGELDVLRDHRSQDRQEPVEPRSDRRRRRGAAAGAVQRGDRAGARQESRRRAGCSTARPPAASREHEIPINDYTRGRASRC